MIDSERPFVPLASGSVRALLCAGLALIVPSTLYAQAAPSVSQPVVQALPSRQSLELNSALARVARDPRNIDALVDAGNAASDLGDFEAAIGFFRRGQELSPKNPRLLAGMAGALAHHGDPVSAISLFSQAEAAGANAASIAADRGLAYDLAGDATTAQRYYQMALGQGGSQADEVRRRLGISYAISGDASSSEKTLNPLLHKQDKAAWRARAFALAIQGQSKEAINITRTLLPARLAESISPYMQYMPRLTSAQQAAAANLGVFPRASDIGRDGTAIASFGTATSDRPRTAAVDRALVPAGQPLGTQPGAAATSARSQAKPTRAERQAQLAEAKRVEREARAARQSARQVARVEPPVPQPARQVTPVDAPGFAVAAPAAVPPVAGILSGRPQPAAVPARPVSPAPAPSSTLGPGFVATAPSAAPAVVLGPGFVAPTTTQPAAPAPVSRPVQPQGFDLAKVPPSAPVAAVPAALAPSAAAAAPVAPPAAAPMPSFGELFRDFGGPTGAIAPAVGAVDIRKIAPARPAPKAPPPKAAPKPPPPPPPPSHPSRIWVQIGIGQKLPALAYDWRRMERTNPVLAKQKPFTAKLNQTNRLLVGPFASQKLANTFIADLRKAGTEGPYIWTSPAGEVVDSLAH